MAFGDSLLISRDELARAQRVALKLCIYYDRKKGKAKPDTGKKTDFECTLTEVAETLGVSKMRTKQIQDEALRTLREGAALNDPRLVQLKDFYKED